MIFIGSFIGVKIVFVIKFEVIIRNILIMLYVGIIYLCWILISFFVICGVIKLIKLIFFEIVIYVFISLILFNSKIDFFFFIEIFKFVIFVFFNWNKFNK